MGSLEKETKERENGDVETQLQLRCKAIQQFLYQNSSTEMIIREEFGDSPDNRKALRLLVKENKVRRFREGGRADPFVYMALVPPPVDLEWLNDENDVGREALVPPLVDLEWLNDENDVGREALVPPAVDLEWLNDENDVGSERSTKMGSLEKETKERENGDVETQLQLRCKAIQQFLKQNSSTEMIIREEFGDSPDTRKALRLLVKENKVRRFREALVPPPVDLEWLNDENDVGREALVPPPVDLEWLNDENDVECERSTEMGSLEKETKERENGDVETQLQLRCKAIQQFLYQNSSTEMIIREQFGDSPDTSKALRLLVKENKVRRFGQGGRADPFVYMVYSRSTGLNYFFQIMKLSMKVSARIEFSSGCVDVTFSVLVQALIPPPVDLEWLKDENDVGRERLEENDVESL